MTRIGAPFLTVLILATGLSLLMTPSGLMTRASAAMQEDDADGIDRIVLRNGRVIEGKILSETDSVVEILVIVGGISAPTTYPRSEVLSIERNVETDTTIPAPASTTKSDSRAETATPRNSNSPDGKRVYVMNLKGDLGRDVTVTPLQRAFDDAISYEPEVIIVKMDCGSAAEGFDGMWTAEDLGPIIEKVIDDGWRVVFWIKRAQAGAAFLPLVSPEIIFMSDGRLGGVGDLSDFNIGDEVVNLKQISLRIGHAEGFAITGGYDPRLIRAMALEEEWLAVKIVGGQPQYITWEPRPEDGEGWTILTDDGKGKNKDKFSFDGNDVLTLNADWARRLNVADAVVDLLDDLIFELNIGRDYTIVEGRADKILSDWSDRIERAIDQFQRLQRDFQEAGQGSASMGRRINILKQMRGLLSANAEVLDPNGAQRAQIDIQIEQLRQQIRRANQRDR